MNLFDYREFASTMSIAIWDMASGPRRPPFLRSRLGAKLRRMRQTANLTVDDAAALLDTTRSKLHRIETGETKPSTHLIRSMMDIYDCQDPALIDEVRAALARPWYHAYSPQNRYNLDVESEATETHDFSPLVIPELLQTEDYTLALLKHWNHPSPVNEMTTRRIRQQRLTTTEHPLRLIAVIDETALRRNVGGAHTMRNQLQRLINTAHLPNITLHTLSAEDQSPCALAGAFTLNILPEATDPDVLHTGHPMMPLDTDDPATVSHAHHVFNHLRNGALSEPDSIDLIKRTLADLGAHHPPTSSLKANDTNEKT
ncbi:helix-turn-helix domain-containing protein [Kibdelosporangium aridum]|uniref:helix-turn-helix domain-containing protein n=1 Tax=Kibdelosporangium aridum TaxID=2030 RepID=UPI0035E6F601